LYELKAEFFRTLAHPGRIRVLELLTENAEMAVRDLQREVGLESSHLSQQLAVLRRAGLVTTRKDGNSVYYALSTADLSELLAVARRILTSRLTEQVDLLRDLAGSGSGAPQQPARASAPRRRRRG
jgi:ArsR family transcriptional regulator